MAKAPSMPVSSEMVKTHSSRPVTRSLSRTARAAAIPMPSSAPRVVSRAIIQPSSITYGMGSREKSCSTPGFFSHTISWWHCSTIVGTCSFPGMASRTITTLPMESVLQNKPRFAAKSCRNAVIGPSWPDSLGIVVISLKISSERVDIIRLLAFSRYR